MNKPTGLSSVSTVSLDQGSTSTKAIIYSQGKTIWQAVIPVGTEESEPNCVEQNPEELLESVNSLLTQALNAAKQLGIQISSIALTCQRSGVLAWDRAGKSLHPLMTWRDRRTKEQLQQAKEHFKFIQEKSGLPVLPDYSGSKIAYLQNKFPNQKIYVGTLDSFLIYNLSDQKAFITDDTMAARSLVYDLELGTWSPFLCRLLKVNKDRLAKIVPSNNPGVSILGMPLKTTIGDGQAALTAVLPEYSAILNLGTISSISVYTGNKLEKINGFIANLAYSTETQKHYMLEGITNASGDVFKFLEEKLKIDNFNKVLSTLDLPEKMPKSLAYLPIRGTATPNWHYDLPSIFNYSNLSKEDALIVGSLSVANFIVKNINLLLAGGYLKSQQFVLAAGGISKFNFLIDYISSVTKITIIQADGFEGSVLGAARLATGLTSKCKNYNFIDRVLPDWCSQYHLDWLDMEKQLIDKYGY